MTKKIALDSNLLGKITHPRKNTDFVQWFQNQLKSGVEVIIPEICDYELRRKLLHKKFTKGLERLDRFGESLTYLPLTTEMFREAATFWAKLRSEGKPTADEKSIDADVILAAQAKSAGAIVVTENVKHLSRLVETTSWLNGTHSLKVIHKGGTQSVN